MGTPTTSSRRRIMIELLEQGHDRMWLSRAVVKYTTALRKAYRPSKKNGSVAPRVVHNPETVMRFLRAETEGGAYLIDACFNVLGLTVVSGEPEAAPVAAIPARRRKKKRRHRRTLQKA